MNIRSFLRSLWTAQYQKKSQKSAQSTSLSGQPLAQKCKSFSLRKLDQLWAKYQPNNMMTVAEFHSVAGETQGYQNMVTFLLNNFFMK